MPGQEARRTTAGDETNMTGSGATPQRMQAVFAAHGFAVSNNELEKFWAHYELLATHNPRLRLTRITGLADTVLKHFIDSAVVAEMMELPGPVLDIGSGGGFPGIPLAIRRPALAVILAESRGKRAAFLETVRERLGLANVSIHPHGIRPGGPVPEGAAVRTAITRALEPIPATLARVRALLPPGGRAVFLKGPGCEGEIATVRRDMADAYCEIRDEAYVLGATDQRRRLVVFERV